MTNRETYISCAFLNEVGRFCQLSGDFIEALEIVTEPRLTIEKQGLQMPHCLFLAKNLNEKI
jgi:hypothetical protein